MRRTIMIFLTVVIFLNGMSVLPIKAEESYKAEFAFVESDNQSLDKEVMNMLPDCIDNLKIGDTIAAPKLEDVHGDGYIYRFLGWDSDLKTIEHEDIHFTGTWKKETDSDIKKKNVYYDFVESFSLDGYGFLPDEIYAMLPEMEAISEDDYPDLPKLDKTNVGEYIFLGWNTPSIEITTGDIVVQGVWTLNNPDVYKDNQKAARAGTTSGLGSAWSYVRNDGTGGYSRYQYTINGSPAWCVEPNITTWPLAGTGYSYVGQSSDKIARIIGLGVQNGMSAGAIQAAIDRYAGHSSSTNDGMDTNPNSANYSGGGSYACKIDIYSPVGYEGEIQKLGTNPRCWPLNPHLSVRKVSSSEYNYSGFCPGIYSLAGAKYGVYSDLNCTNLISTLITGYDGNTNSIELNSGTYYVKEISPSPGYKIDEKTYTAVLLQGSNEIVVSSEDPFDDPTVIRLTKKSSNQNGYTKYLDTAEFTLRYYDTYGEIDSLMPKITWVFKPIIKNGEAIVNFDKEHFVSGEPKLFDENGELKIPLGSFTIEETKAPQTYLRDTNVYKGKVYLEEGRVKVEINGGVDLRVENEQLIQDEKVIILKTHAIFEESGDSSYYADGVAHIKDTVDYENLNESEEYILKGKLVEKNISRTYWTKDDFEKGLCLEDEIDTLKEETVSEGSLILESESEFVAEKSKGSCDVSFEINLDEYPDRDFVVYEYLYSKNEPDKLITYHEDVNDIDQSVHVNPLYEAMFTLYKVSNVSKDIRLSGAYFDVRSTRTKRDGTVVECDLGRYVTGGIYYEDTTPFTLFVYLDEEMTQLVDSYMSGYNERFGMETVSVLDLEDGTYYAKTDISGSKIKQWQIEKGSIYLGYQLEDTKIIFRELIAPVGYHLDTSEYIVDIGHDTSTTRVENYRINALIVPPFVVPKTGIQ